MISFIWFLTLCITYHISFIIIGSVDDFKQAYLQKFCPRAGGSQSKYVERYDIRFYVAKTENWQFNMNNNGNSKRWGFQYILDGGARKSVSGNLVSTTLSVGNHRIRFILGVEKQYTSNNIQFKYGNRAWTTVTKSALQQVDQTCIASWRNVNNVPICTSCKGQSFLFFST